MRRSSRIEENRTAELMNDNNDFGCGVCGDGGDLLCCDSCPSTFHPTCLGLHENLIRGDFHCPYCSCQFCGGYDNPLRVCFQCNRTYHDTCAQSDSKIVGRFGRYYFCGRICRKVFDDIGNVIGVKTEIQNGISWFILPRMTGDVFSTSIYAAVLQIMEESFLPIFDRWTGTNMIRNVITSSSSRLKRLDCSGFHTAVLEREGEIVSAASIRIHGNLAEMPFIATRQSHRRRGNCQLLFGAIEGALLSLGVEELVIPSVRQCVKSWKLFYNFQYIRGTMKQKLRSISTLKFPGTVQLVKFLTVREIGESSGAANAAEEAVEVVEVVEAAATVAAGAEAAVAVEAEEGAVEVVEAAVAVEAQENNVPRWITPDLNLLPPNEDEDESGAGLAVNDGRGEPNEA